jgi:hypothetical protein
MLLMMRWAALGLAGAILIITIIGLVRFPEYAADHLAEFTPNDLWTGIQTQQGLRELGWPPMASAWFSLARDLSGLVLIYSIAAILWKRSNDWFGLYLMVVLIIMGPISGTMFKPVLEILPGLSIINSVSGRIGWQLFFMLFFFFPNGRPVPTTARWFVAGYAVYMLATLFFSGLNNGPLGGILSILMVILAIGSQIYRYFRRSNALERQQTKWVVLVLGFFLLLFPVILLFGFKAPPSANLGPALLKDYGFLILFSLVFWLTPATIAIAVLRYRLWDLDILIRRTLVYGAMTTIIAGIYYGSVLLFGQLFRALTGQDSPLAVVLSTLIIAALFSTLRRRLQMVIDQRFYRRKYNADQAVAAFSAAARSETEVNPLTGQMVRVVEETVQPEKILLWMKDGRQRP